MVNSARDDPPAETPLEVGMGKRKQDAEARPSEYCTSNAILLRPLGAHHSYCKQYPEH